jgi:hypothetical protein
MNRKKMAKKLASVGMDFFIVRAKGESVGVLDGTDSYNDAKKLHNFYEELFSDKPDVIELWYVDDTQILVTAKKNSSIFL